MQHWFSKTKIGLGARPPSHPSNMTSNTMRAKKKSAKIFDSTHERFDVSKKGKINKQAIDKAIAIATPILLGIDFRIA